MAVPRTVVVDFMVREVWSMAVMSSVSPPIQQPVRALHLGQPVLADSQYLQQTLSPR
ncbi:MAG: hypothetical protein IPH54_11940 [Rhodoferax sp.]|nr:hypothetical protein [Rhodoferax sp.]